MAALVYDGGSHLRGPGFYTCSVATDGAIWAAGSDCRVARLVWDQTAQQ